jgi:hypothetical protein
VLPPVEPSMDWMYVKKAGKVPLGETQDCIAVDPGIQKNAKSASISHRDRCR